MKKVFSKLTNLYQNLKEIKVKVKKINNENKKNFHLVNGSLYIINIIWIIMILSIPEPSP